MYLIGFAAPFFLYESGTLFIRYCFFTDSSASFPIKPNLSSISGKSGKFSGVASSHFVGVNTPIIIPWNVDNILKKIRGVRAPKQI